MSEDYEEILDRFDGLDPIVRGLEQEVYVRLPEAAFEECRRRLWRGASHLSPLDECLEVDLVGEYCVYDFRWDGRNVIERYAAESPPSDRDAAAVLQAMLRPRYSLFEVEQTIGDVGLHLRDIFRKDAIFVIDPLVSMNAGTRGILAGRLLTVGDISMLTGATLSVDAAALVHIMEVFAEAGFAPLQGPSQLTPDQQAIYSALVIRSCLEEGVDPDFLYEDPYSDEGLEDDWDLDEEDEHLDEEDENPGGLILPSPPIVKKADLGRNDPCPCGNGKKYKNCCGKK
jgi:hypothetical protein